MVRRPSRVSKVRVFAGAERRAQTRVRSVEDWMAGQLEGSRRSRRSYIIVSDCEIELEVAGLAGSRLVGGG